MKLYAVKINYEHKGKKWNGRDLAIFCNNPDEAIEIAQSTRPKSKEISVTHCIEISHGLTIKLADSSELPDEFLVEERLQRTSKHL